MQPPSVSITRQFRFPLVVVAVLLALLMTGRVEAARQRDPAGSAVSVSGRMLSARTSQAAEPCVAAVACARDSSPARPAGDRAAQLLGAEHARIIARLQQMSPAEAWLLEIDVPASIAKHERALLELRGVWRP